MAETDLEQISVLLPRYFVEWPRNEAKRTERPVSLVCRMLLLREQLNRSTRPKASTTRSVKCWRSEEGDHVELFADRHQSARRRVQQEPCAIASCK